MSQLLVPLIFLGLMWVLLVRPQQQRLRRQRDMLASLEVGDRVLTAGGIFATVVALDDDEASIEVAPGTVLRVVRPAITRRLEPATQPGEALGDGA